jgi:hypothetical protein
MGYHLFFGRQRQEVEVKNPIAVAKKVQKADREKLRRDNLNEQFLELGTTLGNNLLLFLIISTFMLECTPFVLPIEHVASHCPN